MSTIDNDWGPHQQNDPHELNYKLNISALSNIVQINKSQSNKSNSVKYRWALRYMRGGFVVKFGATTIEWASFPALPAHTLPINAGVNILFCTFKRWRVWAVMTKTEMYNVCAEVIET